MFTFIQYVLAAIPCLFLATQQTAGLAETGRRPFPMYIIDGAGGGAIELAAIPEEFDKIKNDEKLTFTGVPLGRNITVDLQMERVRPRFERTLVYVDGAPVSSRLDSDVTIWKGSVLGVEGTSVFLCFSQFGSRGWVQIQQKRYHLLATPDENGDWSAGRSWWIPDEELTSRGLKQDFNCNSISPAPSTSDECGPTPTVPSWTGTPSPLYLCEVVFETDYEYYLIFNNLDAVKAYTASLLAAVGATYQNEIGVVLDPKYVGFYTNANNPWSSPPAPNSSTYDFIYYFQNAWTSSPPPVTGKLYHFLSGKYLGGGIAFLEVLCNPEYNFGVSGNLSASGSLPPLSPGGILAWDYTVVAHEMGHNFGAWHTHDFCPPIDQCAPSGYFGCCQSQQVCIAGTIMSYCHLCGSIKPEFHPANRDQMRARAVACLPFVSFEFEPPHIIDLGIDISFVDLADLDLDGNLDIVTTHHAASNVIIQFGDGQWNGAPVASLTISVDHPTIVRLGDLDVDGDIDILAGGYVNANFYKIINNGNRVFAAPSVVSLPCNVGYFTIGDANADSKLDLIKTSLNSPCSGNGNGISVYSGNGAAGFSFQSQIASLPNAIFIGQPILADFNYDGIPEIVCSGSKNITVPWSDLIALYVYYSNGSGGYLYGCRLSLSDGPQSVAAEDLNGDGFLDVAAGVGFPNAGVAIGYGKSTNVNDLFNSNIKKFNNSENEWNDKDILIADFNADGHADIACTHGDTSVDGDVSFFVNDGIGNFAFTGGLFGFGPAKWIRAGDFNNDGLNDLLAGSKAVFYSQQRKLGIFLSALPKHAEFNYSGTGTAGCYGKLALEPVSEASFGNAQFGFVMTNVPKNSAGALLIVDEIAYNSAGNDLFGLGVQLYFNPSLTSTFEAITIYSRYGGSSFVPIAVPNIPTLAGAAFLGQALWFEKPGWTCGGSTYKLVSSQAVHLIVSD
ncbi:MAG: FG-GAP-like repeat-containing protein [Planctomycetota bacterium]